MRDLWKGQDGRLSIDRIEGGEKNYISFSSSDHSIGYCHKSLKDMEIRVKEDIKVAETFLKHLDEFKKIVKRECPELYGYEKKKKSM